MHCTEPRLRSRLAWVALVAVCTAAQAHEPVARCHLLDAATVRCRGASNEGELMPGSRMEAIALDGRTLQEGRLGADSTWTFDKPAQPFYVLFDTGPGLQVSIEQEEIALPPAGRVHAWMRKP